MDGSFAPWSKGGQKASGVSGKSRFGSERRRRRLPDAQFLGRIAPFCEAARPPARPSSRSKARERRKCLPSETAPRCDVGKRGKMDEKLTCECSGCSSSVGPCVGRSRTLTISGLLPTSPPPPSSPPPPPPTEWQNALPGINSPRTWTWNADATDGSQGERAEQSRRVIREGKVNQTTRLAESFDLGITRYA